MTEQEYKLVARTAAAFATSSERSRCLAVVTKYLKSRIDADKPLPEAERKLLFELAGVEAAFVDPEEIDRG